ncbi:hypothetical protein [Streptomyces halobius]|uniref:Uncharacterized protein n=1 Tax=Streptomyces halobius TaxID=2879846 RepID=A0ABY4M1P0_9ACTN|nr:hypothetical protein [Streptomyces halobius]UQA91143.1 hypothetical protein K9S39_03910 [Streptomyces halobius]
MATARDCVLPYTLLPLGMLLVAIGYLGAVTGVTMVPFDPHHIGTQIVGLVLAFIGLRHWR